MKGFLLGLRKGMRHIVYGTCYMLAFGAPSLGSRWVVFQAWALSLYIRCIYIYIYICIYIYVRITFYANCMYIYIYTYVSIHGIKRLHIQVQVHTKGSWCASST